MTVFHAQQIWAAIVAAGAAGTALILLAVLADHVVCRRRMDPGTEGQRRHEREGLVVLAATVVAGAVWALEAHALGVL